MNKHRKIISIMGFMMLFWIGFIALCTMANFSFDKIPVVLIHKVSAIIMCIGVATAVLAAGPSEVFAAFKKSFFSRYCSCGEDLEESRLALVKASKIIWLFAFLCSVFNFISTYMRAGGGSEAILDSTQAAVYPLLYAIIVANFLLMSMAVFIHKLIIDPEEEPVCIYCGIEINVVPPLVCPQCMEEARTKAAERGK